MIKTKTHITSLAAPTKEDFELLKAMSNEERIELLRAEIEAGRADIAEGRCTEFESDEDIQKFFESVRAKYETQVI